MAGEGAGIRERVEHPAPRSVRGHQRLILALVEVETGLLAGAHQDGEPALALGHHQLGRPGLAAPAAFGLEALDPRRRRLIEPIDASPREQRLQRGRHPRFRARHAEGLALDHAHRPVAVHHQAGKPICLAPAEAERLAQEPRRTAVVEGRAEPAEDECLVDGLVEPREEAAGQRGPRVVEASAQESSAGVQHLHGVARRPPASEIGDLAPVDPGMAGPEAPLHPLLEDQCGQEGGAISFAGRRSSGAGGGLLPGVGGA